MRILCCFIWGIILKAGCLWHYIPVVIDNIHCRSRFYKYLKPDGWKWKWKWLPMTRMLLYSAVRFTHGHTVFNNSIRRRYSGVVKSSCWGLTKTCAAWVGILFWNCFHPSAPFSFCTLNFFDQIWSLDFSDAWHTKFHHLWGQYIVCVMVRHSNFGVASPLS